MRSERAGRRLGAPTCILVSYLVTSLTIGTRGVDCNQCYVLLR
jgi:hypothetical protein